MSEIKLKPMRRSIVIDSSIPLELTDAAYVAVVDYSKRIPNVLNPLIQGSFSLNYGDKNVYIKLLKN